MPLRCDFDKSHNCAGTAFVQGNSAGGSKLIEQTLPNFAPVRLILKLSSLNSVESEIALRKLLFLGRMITENKLTPTVRNLFHYRDESFLMKAFPP